MSSVPAILSYAETLLARRRVGLVGRGAAAIAERVATTEPRHIVAFDPDVHASFDALRPAVTTVRPLPELSSALRPGALDVIFVLDVRDVLPLANFLPVARRLLTPQGLLLAHAPVLEDASSHVEGKGAASVRHPAGAPSFEELFELFSLQFEEVRVLGVLPFYARALVELGVEDPDVSVDTQGVSTPASPDAYLVCASPAALELESYAIIQEDAPDVLLAALERLPVDRGSSDEASLPREPAPPNLDAVNAARIAALEASLEDARTQLRQAELARERDRDDPEKRALQERLREAESRLRIYGAEAHQQSAENERLRDALREREREVTDLRAHIERAAEVEGRDGRDGKDASADREAVAREAKVREEYTQMLETREVEYLRDREHAKSELARAQSELTRAQSELARAQSELEEVRGALTQRDAETEAVVAATREATRAEAMAAQREALVAAKADASLLTDELLALEAKLADLGARLQERDAEVRKRGRLVEELVARLSGRDGAVASPPAADLAPQLEALAHKLTLAHGELEARGWRIHELELQLELAAPR
jgi:hypothetical protein